MSNKSRIIYEPSYVIKDRRLLTTLCILYDEVMLFNDKSIEDELLFLKSLEANNKANVEVFNIKVDEKVNKLTADLINCVQMNRLKISDFIRAINLYSVSNMYNIPIFTIGNQRLVLDNRQYVDFLTNNLAVKSMCELALPEIVTNDIEEILYAKDILKDELLQFKAAMLELTYTLHHSLHNRNDLQNIK